VVIRPAKILLECFRNVRRVIRLDVLCKSFIMTPYKRTGPLDLYVLIKEHYKLIKKITQIVQKTKTG
jgi:hypothetical protein